MAPPGHGRTPGWTWLLLPILPVAFFVVLHQVDRVPEGVDAYAVTHADFVRSESAIPPAAAREWEVHVPVTVHRPGESAPFTSVWYRIRLPNEASEGERWAVYLPSPLANLAVFFGERLLGTGGPMREPLPYHSGPLWFEFHPTAHGSSPEIFVRVARKAPRTSLPVFFVGQVDALRPAFETERLLKRTVPAGIVVFMAALCTIVGAIWIFRRQETAYGWYALFILLWALYTAHAWVVRPPIDHWLWWSVSYLALSFTLAGAIFVNRFFDLPSPRAERAITAFFFAGSMAVLFAGVVDDKPFRDTVWTIAWLSGIGVVAAYGLAQYLRGALRSPTWENLSMSACFALTVVVGVRDSLYTTTDWVPGSTLYLQYTAPIILAVFALSLMRRFAHSLNESETLAQTLEQRVAEKTDALEEHFERVRHLEAERILLEERDRIMRDVHDGIGGQLVQLVGLTSDRPELAHFDRKVRGALTDLRLIVDSLVPSEGDLVSVLAAFRHRVGEAVRAQGIEFRWQIDVLPPIEDLGPERVLHVLRILQEAVTNVLEHAGARTLTVEARVVSAEAGEADSIVIDVLDDGLGIAASARTSGRGIRNMMHRAGRIGASLTVDAMKPGTRVRLALPLVPARA